MFIVQSVLYTVLIFNASSVIHFLVNCIVIFIAISIQPTITNFFIHYIQYSFHTPNCLHDSAESSSILQESDIIHPFHVFMSSNFFLPCTHTRFLSSMSSYKLSFLYIHTVIFSPLHIQNNSLDTHHLPQPVAFLISPDPVLSCLVSSPGWWLQKGLCTQGRELWKMIG